MSEVNSVMWPGWETVRMIGRGGFGAVYEIQRTIFSDTEQAALKVISIPQNESDIDELYSEGYDSETVTSTFQAYLQSIVAEYSLMRKLNGSAHIVSCDDVRYVQHDDGIGWDIFIKMELLTALPKALPAQISEDMVLKIARDMCAALELCNEYKIVHRDIKPQNIFVSKHGDYKLGDFGIAKTVEKTMGGTKIGTYKYMAPEVYNNKPYGATADIYSLGLVLYWLLNEKRMPFLPLPPEKLRVGMEEEARNRRLVGEKLPEPAHGSPWLKKIVMKACAYDPKDRYQTAREMHQDLMAEGRAAATFVTAASAFAAPAVPDQDEPTALLDEQTMLLSESADEQTALLTETAEDLTVLMPADPEEATVPMAEEPEKGKETSLKENWRCGVCGRENVHYFNSCFCGAKKPKEHALLANGNWRCGVCGRENASYFNSCACGTKKQNVVENKTIHPKEEATVQKTSFAESTGRKQNGQIIPKKESDGKTVKKKRSILIGAVALIAVLAILTPILTRPKTGQFQSEATMISASAFHTVGLRNDGTVVAVGSDSGGGRCNVKSWTDIQQISTGVGHTVGLKTNGTVIAVGDNLYGQCDVENWKDMVFVSAGWVHTVGLREDGTVVATGNNDHGQCEVQNWTKIVAISAGTGHTVGLKDNGEVVAVGNNEYGQCNVQRWKNIVAVSASATHTVGLKADGTVVAVGSDEGGMCDVRSWTDIIAISAGDNHTVGLKSNGTVVATGYSDYRGQSDVGDWTDIVAISAGSRYTVGLKSDGTVVAVGKNSNGECNVGDWVITTNAVLPQDE